VAEIGTAIGVTIPSPLVTPGPDWAQEITDFLQEVADGFLAGVRSSIGLTIDAAVPMVGYALADAGAVLFRGGGAPAAGTRAVYVDVAGELHYVDASGVDIQLTSVGHINAASNRGFNGDYGVGGNPADASFLEASNTFVFTQDSGVAAPIDGGAVRVREATVGANYVELASPASLAASYQLKFPTATPASTSLVLLASGGQLSTTRSPTLDALTVTGTATVGFVAGVGAAFSDLVEVDQLSVLDNGTTALSVVGGVVAAKVNGTTWVQTAEADVRHAARTIRVAHPAVEWISSTGAPDLTLVTRNFSGIAQRTATSGGSTATGLLAIEVPVGVTITTVVAQVKGSTGTPPVVRLVSVSSTGSTSTVGSQTASAAATDQTLTIGSLAASTASLWYVIEVDLTDSGARLYAVTYTYTRP
jgi:hypothetical protein